MAGFAKLWSGDGVLPLVSDQDICNQAPLGRAPGRIYFIESGIGGPIKIGFAFNPYSRVRELQCGNPTELHLLGMARWTMYDEKTLHRRFARHRVAGEWFSPCDELWRLIRKHWCHDPGRGERDSATDYRTLLVVA